MEEKMTVKKLISVIICVCLVFLACVKRGENKSLLQNTQYQDLSVSERVDDQYLTEEEAMVKKKIPSLEGKEIKWLKKVNFGIPGGDNWLVSYYDKIDGYDSYGLRIYIVTDDTATKVIYLINFAMSEYSQFDIMKDIPGIRIAADGCSALGDYNGDGFDEIFQYSFYGLGWYVEIWGYNEELKEFIPFCQIQFDIIDPVNGPAPASFTNYQGTDGLMVFYSGTVVAGDEPISFEDNNIWYFFTWDNQRKEYITVGKVTEEIN
jgi:hypothetical protein